MTWDHKVDWYGMGGYPIPLPNSIVRYADGRTTALMFHFMPTETITFAEVASDNGFDFKSIGMEDNLAEDDPIFVAYFAGDGEASKRWVPPSIDGWQMVGVEEGEDGPFALYIKPREKIEVSS